MPVRSCLCDRCVDCLRYKRKQALHNMRRQRNRELMGRHVDVRVSSSFWRQVASEYEAKLKRLGESV